MKFTCSQSSLSKAINTVNKAVSVRTTIPILKGILLNIKDNRLKLSASDLDISIETTIDVQNSENGSCVVSAKLFSEIIRKLPNSLLTAELKDNKLNINCLGSNFSIISLEADEFPIIKGIESKEFLDINKNNFVDLIKKVSFAASVDEKKGILTGTLLNFENNELEMVALDGFRMAVSKNILDSNLNKKIVIPARILNEIQKILIEDEGSETISLLVDEKKIEVRTEETMIVSRLLEGEFIKYKDIIPASYKTKMVVNRIDMLSSIERASLLAKEGKNNLIKITIENGDVNVSSRSDEGNVNEKVGAEVEGADLTIGFNSKYLIDVLKAVNDEEITFEMGTSVSACVLKPVDGDNYSYLVLPVRITAA